MSSITTLKGSKRKQDKDKLSVEEQEIGDQLQQNFPPGTLVRIRDSTGIASASIYCVIKHLPPGRIIKTKPYRPGRKPWGPFKRHVWETQVQNVFRPSTIIGESTVGSKTTYSSERIEKFNLLCLLQMRRGLDELIQSQIPVAGELGGENVDQENNESGEHNEK